MLSLHFSMSLNILFILTAVITAGKLKSSSNMFGKYNQPVFQTSNSTGIAKKLILRGSFGVLWELNENVRLTHFWIAQ